MSTLRPGRIPKDRKPAQVFDTAVEILAALAELRRKKDPTLSVETHNDSPLEKPDEAWRLARALWPRVGLTYDPSHFIMQGIPLQKTERVLEADLSAPGHDFP